MEKPRAVRKPGLPGEKMGGHSPKKKQKPDRKTTNDRAVGGGGRRDAET